MNDVAPRRQAPLSDSSGRVNQKRRTRAAIVAAARAIYERGETPTIAQVADEALMTRQTVYRYFRTAESLLLELNIGIGINEFDEAAREPHGDTTAQERFDRFVAAFNRFCVEHQALHRNAQRHYLDLWLAAERGGRGHEQPLREGRRTQWIASLLGADADALPRDDRRRLEAALGLVMGGEAINVLTDVYHLDADEVVAVTTWAADTLLVAALNDQEPLR